MRYEKPRGDSFCIWPSKKKATRSFDVDRHLILVALAHEFYVSAALLCCPAVDLSNPARDLRDPAERLLHPAAVLRPAAIGSSLRVSRLIGLVLLRFVKRF